MDLDPNTYIPVAGAAAGAGASLKFIPGDTWSAKFTNTLAGFASAIFIAPATADYFHLASVNARGGLSFAMGLFGVSIISAIMAGIKGIDVAALVTGWFKKGG